MANIPQPPEEDKEDEKPAEQGDEKEKHGTENANEINEEAGWPIVNEVEQMEEEAN